MTKLHETPQDCPALAEAILPNGQTLYCQFDNYDQLKNFQIESGGKPCLVQFDRDNNVKTVQHNFNHDSLDWRKEWTDYTMYTERPWHLLKDLYDNSMTIEMDTLYRSLLKSFDWDREEIKVLISLDLSEREFYMSTIQYPVVNQNIGNGLNESMGVIV